MNIVQEWVYAGTTPTKRRNRGIVAYVSFGVVLFALYFTLKALTH